MCAYVYHIQVYQHKDSPKKWFKEGRKFQLCLQIIEKRFLAPLTFSSTIHKNMHMYSYMYLPKPVLLDTNSHPVAQYDLDIQYTDC